MFHEATTEKKRKKIVYARLSFMLNTVEHDGKQNNRQKRENGKGKKRGKSNKQKKIAKMQQMLDNTQPN